MRPVSRVTLVVGSLAGGGIARATTTIANYWAERNWSVSLVTFDPPNTRCHYANHADVDIHYADLVADSHGKFDATIRNLRRVLRLRRLILNTRPESIIAFGDQTNVLVLLALAGTGLPVIVSERIDPRHHEIGPVWSALRRLSYAFARWIVVQTDGVRETFSERLRKKIVTIPNPVPAPRVFAKPDAISVSGPVVIAMGRLNRQKGFDMLLEAFARIAKPTFPENSATRLTCG